MYLSKMTNEQAAELAQIADAARAELEPLVLGQSRAAWSCCCGAIKHNAATAIAIRTPGERGYPEQDAGWCTWSVRMCDTDDRWYSMGITDFVPREQLDAIFELHFRRFVAEHSQDELGVAAARRAPGGDLYGRDISIWF
jgi:hypothetical protein